MSGPATGPAPSPDAATAAAFSESWLHCFAERPYTREQFEEWMAPLTAADLAGRSICELGCGGGGLLVYAAEWAAGGRVTGVELGASIAAAARLLAGSGATLERADLVEFSRRHPGAFEVVYCIGVLHHLASPLDGFRAVVRTTAPGGRFHCWVYAHEGNAPVRWLVEPLRRVASRLPWWLNKWAIALPLAVPFFLAARLAARLDATTARRLPLGDYLRWIGRREFAFHHHVAFDQLVAPRTSYLRREELEGWLAGLGDEIESTYVVLRNGNSWKLGGRRRSGGRGGEA